MESRTVHIVAKAPSADVQDVDAQDTKAQGDTSQSAEARAADRQRKQAILAKLYNASPPTRYLAANVRKQHTSLFALNLYNDHESEPRMVGAPRAGLIIAERTMSYLALEFEREGFINFVKTMSEPARQWAPVVYDQWKMELPDGTRGRWLILPVLYGFLEIRPKTLRSDVTSDQERTYMPSTIRSVLIGLEAMGVVEKRNAHLRVNPKSRTKVVRLTKVGSDLVSELSK